MSPRRLAAALTAAHTSLEASADELLVRAVARGFVEHGLRFEAEALFLAAYLSQKVLNDTKGAIALFTELKQKYPRTTQGFDADNYLAQLGVYNVN